MATALPATACAAAAAVAPPPIATELAPVALAKEPRADAFAPEADALMPIAVALTADAVEVVPMLVAPMADAFEAQPTAVALAAVALVWRPKATELPPVATEASPMATLIPVAVAPLPPPMAIENTSDVAGNAPPEPRAVPLPIWSIWMEVPARANDEVKLNESPAASAKGFLIPLEVPLLVFLHASSEATTQLPVDSFQTIENILFIL